MSFAEWDANAAASYGFVSLAFLLGARALYGLYNSPEPEPFTYVPWQTAERALQAQPQQPQQPHQAQEEPPPPEQLVVVDATHPHLPTLSHHKGASNPAGLRPSDTSTGLVLNALGGRAQWGARDVAAVTRRRCVTTNHFDVDSFLSVWAFINREQALRHEGVLRHMARIGDFREAFLSPDIITAHGASDGITFIREAYTALKLVCWLNTLERRLFSAPYEEAGDCAAKMDWFLPRFGAVLADPESAWGDWQAEYTRVVSGFDLLAGADCMVETPPGLGLAVLSAPEPLHYYSLFSHTIGYDVVLCMYDDQRYEVECKYSQFVVLPSRPVWPRLDLAPLATLLNTLEARYAAAAAAAAGDDAGAAAPGQEGGLVWVANSLTDTGPMLRLQPAGQKLSKAKRYGHPYERRIYSSSIPPRRMAALVQSFLGFGLQGLRPEPGGWDWSTLHEINQQIHWQDWASCLLEQASRGELDAAAGSLTTPRRRSTTASYAFSAGGNAAALAGAGPSDAAAAPDQAPLAARPGGAATGSGYSSPANLLVPGVPLAAGDAPPTLSQPSVIASPEALAALASALPPLHRGTPWLLLYSTHRDGTSLHTLLRKAEKAAPSLLLVRDSRGGLFGAYTADAWHVAPRFYGSGECFVFQLEPRRLAWPWLQRPGLRNDFFQYASPEGLGVGGAGHWALSVDEELLAGSSGPCDTFGCPCLASGEEFEVLGVELWHVH